MFIWGDGGQQLTPEQIAAQQKIAQAMMLRGSDYSPVQHWTQGMARVAESLVGGLRERGANEAARANAASETELLSGLMTPQALSQPMGNAVQSAPVQAASPSTTGKIYANDEPSPLDPPSGRDRDLAIRTIVGEAGNEGTRGQNAVAAVIRNRAVNGGYGGDTAGGVVMSPNQFEPWNGGPAKERMLALSPTDPKYQQAGQALDMAYAGEDPTNGAVNFVAPKAQAALGRPMPSWAPPGQGQDIGNHRFFGSPSPPAAPYQVAGDPVAAPAGAPAVPAASPAVPVAAPPVAAPPGVNPKLLAAMSSPYVSDGTKRILGAMLQQQMKPQEYTYQTTPDGTILRMDPRGGAPQPVYTAATKATHGVIGKDQFGNEQYGWIDPVKRTTEPTGGSPAAAAPMTVTGPDGKEIPIPPNVDPKAFRQHVTTATADAVSGKKTEVQAKAEQFGNRMEQAEAAIAGGLEKQGTGWSGAAQQIVGSTPVIGSALQTSNYQQFSQAKSQFITALLRQESGAAIGKEEFARYDKEFFPQPGDAPEVIAQKAQSRQVAIAAMKKGAGPGYKSPDLAKPPRVTKSIGGKSYYQENGQWFEE